MNTMQCLECGRLYETSGASASDSQRCVSCVSASDFQRTNLDRLRGAIRLPLTPAEERTLLWLAGCERHCCEHIAHLFERVRHAAERDAADARATLNECPEEGWGNEP